MHSKLATPGSSKTPLTIALVLVLTAGCDCDTAMIGAESFDAAADAAPDETPTASTDECGNGMDDDLDRRIDEGCFCGNGESQSCYSGTLATNLVGRCARGTQRCRIEGTAEWGMWGECQGDVTPGEETCEGTDEDCDGAIDEGCPCTEGETRLCEVAEFVTPPCMGGEQACSAEGRWGDCEGAVRPEPERCDNGIDDDCDGAVDDPSFCGCTPMPELCGNGVDDDCDGAVDEPDACSSCEPMPESCDDGEDQDCDGRVDEGCAVDAGPPPQDAGACDPSVPAPRPLSPMSTSFVTTQRPELRWERPAGVDGGLVELCPNRACSGASLTTATGTDMATPDVDLPAGVVFWRVRGRRAGTVGCEPSPTWQLVIPHRSAPASTHWGTSLDVNGDGFDDLAVGAPEEPLTEGDGTRVGRVYVYAGSASGPATRPSTTLDSPWTVRQLVESYGDDVQSAGDVNGDGFGDLIVGAPRNDLRDTYHGRAYVYHGGPSGLSATPATSLRNTVELGSDSTFGRYVVGLGDVDGDGYGDVAVASDESIHVFFGSSSGIASASGVRLTVSDPVALGGFRAASACDVNGDGYADLMGGNPLPRDFSGVGYIWYGSPSGLDATPTVVSTGISDGFGLGVSVGCVGDVDGDGYPDLAFGASGTRTVDLDGRVFIAPGGASGVELGTELSGPRGFGDSVAHVGDLDGDGFHELAVSTSAGFAPGVAGEITVYAGASGGPSDSPWFARMSPAGSGWGDEAAFGGDLDGDGLFDLVGAVPGAAAFVYFGNGTGLSSSPDAPIFRAGSSGNQFGRSVGSSGSS